MVTPKYLTLIYVVCVYQLQTRVQLLDNLYLRDFIAIQKQRGNEIWHSISID